MSAAAGSDEHRRQGNERLAAGDLAGAEQCYRRSIAAKPDAGAAHIALGYVLLEQARLSEARQYLERAAALDPREPDAHFLLGRIAQQENRIDDAIRDFDRAVGLRPGFAEALFGRGVALRVARRLDEALASFDAALAIAPDFPECRFNKGLVLLLRAQFAEGLELFESRIGTGPADAHSQWLAQLSGRKPLWRGEPLDGKRLLIWMDQGLGDCLMMMRYLPMLPARGVAQIIVLADPALARLVETLPVPLQVTTDAGRLPLDTFDAHCLMTSLPYAFGTRADTIPANVPYLTVPHSLREAWAARLAGLRGCRVGLVWAGSRTFGRDPLRSVALAQFAPLAAIDGVDLVSLQKGEPASERAALDGRLFDRMHECVDFMDTAALVENLDLIVSVDTSVAHLAGALGKPVWLLNRYESEWRWQVGRTDSPWYPTMRIFNQPAPGDWAGAIGEIARELARYVASRAGRTR